MMPFTVHRGRVAPLDRVNVDTDQIIPKQFLKRIERTGFGQFVFYDWRFAADGTKNPDFVLHEPRYDGASILVAGKNFGCGSSREHAVWALMNYGFRVVISSRFADIFRGNSGKAGLLTAQADQADVELLWKLLETEPGTEVTVDLRSRTITAKDIVAPFQVDDYIRWRLLEGLDDIGLTLRHEAAVTAYEASRPAWKPTVTAG